MNALHLACAADQAYAPHSAAMLHSALAHRGKRELVVHYLCGPRFSEEEASALSAMVELNGGRISFLRVEDERVEGLPVLDFISAPMWYRIYLPELLPEVDRLLYLDIDTIVTDSLEPLAATDLSDCYVGAVTNVFQAHETSRPGDLGLPAGQAYFNSGVLLMNLELMRRDGCSEALGAFARRAGSALDYPDQDALNVVLGARRLVLHPRWNCMNSFEVFPWSAQVLGAEPLAEALRNPAIRHFEGPSINKPWHYLCERPMKEVYFEHRAHTPWPEVEVEGRTLRNMLERAMRGLRRKGGTTERGQCLIARRPV